MRNTSQKILTVIAFLILSSLLTIAVGKQLKPAKPLIWHQTDSAIISPSYCDTVPQSERYTMMMVYQSLQPDSAQQLWKICYTDSSSVSVTTLGLQHSPTRPLATRSFPCIYTMQHSIDADTTHHDSIRLYTGTDNRADSSHIKFYEAAYFDQRLNRRQSLMFQTYLAIKYGITLDNAHYLSTSGDTLWNAKSDHDHYHRIIGLASDSVYNLFSTHSTSLQDTTIQISTPHKLPIETYTLIGDDNNSLDWFTYNDTISMLHRTWKLRINNNIPHITVKLNLNKIPDARDLPKLAVINTEHEVIQVIEPDSVDTCNHVYYTLPQPLNQTLFTLISSEVQLSQTHRNKGKIDAPNIKEPILLTANSIDGNVALKITMQETQDIMVVIQDPTGKTIIQQPLSGTDTYYCNYSINSRGIYIISIYSKKNEILATQEIVIN